MVAIAIKVICNLIIGDKLDKKYTSCRNVSIQRAQRKVSNCCFKITFVGTKMFLFVVSAASTVGTI